MEEVTYAELATATGLLENEVQRILRCAITFHIFREPRKGVIAHTAASKLLADDPLMRHWIGMVSEEIWPAASKARLAKLPAPKAVGADNSEKAVEALRQWPKSEEPNHSACHTILFSNHGLKI